MKNTIPVLLKENGDPAFAAALAEQLDTVLLTKAPAEPHTVRRSSAPSDMIPVPEELCAPVWLSVDADGLSLEGNRQSMRGDFTVMEKRLQYHNLTHELLVKAAKIKGRTKLWVIDATAGMGEDSLLLAAAGCRVSLCEQDPVIAALLQDTLRRAQQLPLLQDIVGRMQLIEGDSIAWLHALAAGASSEAARPDVVYLDPMFPERQKSGLIKKKFQLLHFLEAPAENEDALFRAAQAVQPFKIVVKRPAKGPFLAGRKPSYSLDGKAIRYDCYLSPFRAG